MKDAEFTKVAKALADSTRLKMLREVREAGELTCSCLCECFPLSQPTISHHIRTLESAGLFIVRKDGQFHRLTVNETVLVGFAAHFSGAPTPRANPRAKRAAAGRKPSVAEDERGPGQPSRGSK